MGVRFLAHFGDGVGFLAHFGGGARISSSRGEGVPDFWLMRGGDAGFLALKERGYRLCNDHKNNLFI